MQVQEYPFWYYAKIPLIDSGGNPLGPQYFTRSLKFGYDYLVRGFLVSWPMNEFVGAANDVAPELELNFVQYERNRPITQTPIPFRDFATPVGKEFVTGYTQNADRQLGRAFMPYNYLLSNKDALQLVISGQENVGAAGGEPDYIRLTVVGRNVRAKND